MPSRRHHSKTRHGCKNCKLRKVKCDLQKPICSNCHRRDEICHYPSASGANGSPPLDSPASRAIQGQMSLDMESLELLHHYATVVSLTLSSVGTVRHMWQIDLPKLAFKYPFLMHSILAVSALHLVLKAPRTNDHWRETAIKHQDAALEAFKPLVLKVDAENCHAVVATATNISLFSAGIQNILEDSATTVIHGLLEIGELGRGVRSMVDTSYTWIKGGQIGPLVNRIPWLNPPALRQDICEALEKLRGMINASSREEEDKLVYLDAIDLLRQTFQATALNSQHSPMVFMFVVLTARRFFDAIRASDHYALVILAHYGVILQGSAELWWSRNWGVELLDAVLSIVGDTWLPALEWPVKMLENIQEQPIYVKDFMPEICRTESVSP